MPVAPPRTLPVFGRRTVAGWLVLRSVHGDDGARQRVAALWEPGATLREVEGGWWLELPAPRSLRPPWPAQPVVLTPRGATTAPASQPPGELGLQHVVEGAWCVQTGTTAQPEEWVHWPFVEVAVRALPTPARAPTAPPPQAPPAPSDFGVAGPPAERDDILAQLRGERPAPPAPGPAHGMRQRLAGLLDRLRQALSAPAASESATAGQPASPASESATAGQPASPAAESENALAPRKSWLERLRDWIAPEQLAAHHEAYVERLEKLFAGDDLDEALRRALPLGDLDDTQSAQTAGRSLADNDHSLVPRTHRNTGAAPGVYTSDGLRQRLRLHYQRSANQLERAGEYDKAAFVYVDLLGQPLQAVNMLEKHKRYALAAKLCEAWLDAPRAAELYVRAGDVPAALRITYDAGCYESTLSRLINASPEHVHGLRAAWAAHLVERGDLLRATEVVEPDDKLYPAAIGWLGPLRHEPGPRGLRARLHLLVLGSDDALPSDLLAELNALGPHSLGALAPELARLGRAHATAIALYRHCMRRALPHLPPALRKGQESALADLFEHLPAAHPSWTDSAGPVEVHAAELLTHGPIAVLTPYDLRLYDRDGSELLRHGAFFDYLVAPMAGRHLLALRHLDEDTVGVWRVDTLRGTVERWTELPLGLDALARIEDVCDDLWWVALADQIIALDTGADGSEARVALKGMQPSQLLGVDRARQRVVAVVGQEQWTWTGPRWRLSQRSAAQDITKVATRHLSNGPELVTTAACDPQRRLKRSVGRVELWHHDTLEAVIVVR